MDVPGKTHTLSKPNGIFVCLLDYEDESDLTEVIALLEERLGSLFPELKYGPYSSFTETEHVGRPLVAMYHQDTGCCLKLQSHDNRLAAQIVARLYPS